MEFIPATFTTSIRNLSAAHKTEIILTLVCLTTLLSGFIGELTGLASPESVRWFYLVSYLSGGYYGAKQSAQALLQGKLNVDILMILAAIGAAVIDSWLEGAILLFLFSLSNSLEHYAMGRSRREIESIMKLRPDRALLRKSDGREESVPVEDLAPGDLIVVRPGERIPIDGRVASGTSSVNQSTITGESAPVSKESGDEVFAATLNENGVLTIEVSRRSDETTLANIIRLVEQARSQKAKTQRFLDTFEPRYALGVILATTGLILIPWLMLDEPFEPVFYRAMTILVVASPCALIISTPASILSAIASSAKNGVLFKGGAHLEQAATINSIAFDKTGTLTTGQPELSDLLLVPGRKDPWTEDEFLQYAATAEKHSEHHLASAILREAERRGVTLLQADKVDVKIGKGIRATIGGTIIRVGNRKLGIPSEEETDRNFLNEVEELEAKGRTVIFLARDDIYMGAMAFADKIKPEAKEALKNLKEAGVDTITMLTGDSERVARSVADELGITSYFAELLPEQKVEKIRSLSRQKAVAMVGDGVNDAPALAASRLGIAMGAAGTDVALETADVVLMSDDLNKLAWMIRLSKKSKRVVWQNIVFSLAVITLLVSSVFLFDLPLPLGVVAHEGSTLLVVLNGLRLLGNSDLT